MSIWMPVMPRSQLCPPKVTHDSVLNGISIYTKKKRTLAFCDFSFPIATQVKQNLEEAGAES